MKRVLMAAGAIALALTLGACTDHEGAQRALSAAGFSNIKLGGYDLWACAKGDNFATQFSATNPQGRTVTGTVCSGWVKGATIRF